MGESGTTLLINVEDVFQAPAARLAVPVRYWERFDGRIARNLAQVADALDTQGARATFAVTPWNAVRLATELQRLVAAGHEVMLAAGTAKELAAAGLPTDEAPAAQAGVLEKSLGCRVRGVYLPAAFFPSGLVDTAGFAYAVVDDERQVCAGITRFVLPAWREGLLRKRRGGLGFMRRFEVGPGVDCGDGVCPLWLWEPDEEQPLIYAMGKRLQDRLYPGKDLARRNLAWLVEHGELRTFAERLGLAPASVPVDTGERLAPHDVAAAREPGESAQAAGRTALTVVVPCYNEEASIPFLARTLNAFGQAEGRHLELGYVFVDDGSRDATWTLLHEHFGDWPRVQLVRHPVNKGIGAGILTGFAHAGTDLVAVIDADCTFDPAQLPDMLALLEPGVDAVTASPLGDAGAMENVPAWRQAMSYGAAFLYRLVMREKLSSYTSCFRVYRHDAVAGMRLGNHGFCGVTEILGRMDLDGRHFVEFPAELGTRLLGQSKINTLRTIRDHLGLVARLGAARWLGVPLRTLGD